MIEDAQFWINTADFGRIAQIDERNARAALQSCLSDGQWRGTSLQVRKNGKGYMVDVRSMPPGLFAAWCDKNPDAVTITAIPKNAPLPMHYDPKAGEKSTLRAWKIDLIAPALQHPIKSRDRAAALKDIAAARHIRADGKRIKVPMRTLQNYIKKFSDEGVLSLQRKTRKEKKPRRVFVNRAWDKACPLPEADKQKLSDEINIYVKSLVQKQGDTGKKSRYSHRQNW